MSCKKGSSRMAKNGQYFKKLFHLTKRNNAATLCGKNSEFTDTEIRLFSEIIETKSAGERLISTQLADRLGVTRSAISQIVNRLEERNMVKRVADEVDRKIAYIEMTEYAMECYEETKKILYGFTGKCVERMGEERFEQMCAALDEFITIVEEEKSRIKA
ncbi:MAG: MarR family transcriptional regulator [Clostridia bacterium]|nr:MarR family transcriptional regulator [Clostridia bacterium]